jgi:endogenous inhibitor of DNA gyrase (YacG/DUF329 family)
MFTLVCPTCQRSITCQAPSEAPYRPFCCERCRLVDLHKWLNGEYVISDPIPGGRDNPGDRPREDASEES